MQFELFASDTLLGRLFIIVGGRTSPFRVWERIHER